MGLAILILLVMDIEWKRTNVLRNVITVQFVQNLKFWQFN